MRTINKVEKEYILTEIRPASKPVHLPPSSSTEHGFRKFNLKRNIYELLEYTCSNGPYRCPNTGSSLLKGNFKYLAKFSIYAIIIFYGSY